MKLGLKLVSVRKPIGIFTWHEDDIAKRLGPHGENALTDVNRKTLHMRLAKLWFRLRHILEGGLLRPWSIEFSLFRSEGQPARITLPWPRVGL